MTVCIAAVCEQVNVVVGISDRMITFGEIAFEPSQTKFQALTHSATDQIVVMFAGASPLHSDIWYLVQDEIYRGSKPVGECTVKGVAEMYSRHYIATRAKHAERAVLAPLGLTLHTFLANQSAMKSKLVTKLADELRLFGQGDESFDVSAIVCGLDRSIGDPAGHIYVVNNGKVECADDIGFAAIGNGDWHANSQLMLGGHNREASLAQTMFLIYSAKKLAEVVEGIGIETDMFTVRSDMVHIYHGDDFRIERLDEIYQKTEEKKRELTRVAVDETAQIVVSAMPSKRTRLGK